MTSTPGRSPLRDKIDRAIFDAHQAYENRFTTVHIPFTDEAAESARRALVEHPSHYTKGSIEVWDFIIDQELSYCLGNVVKYVARSGKKVGADPIQDLKKARAYIDREIERLVGEPEPEPDEDEYEEEEEECDCDDCADDSIIPCGEAIFEVNLSEDPCELFGFVAPPDYGDDWGRGKMRGGYL